MNGTISGTQENATLSYLVTKSSGGILNLNVTLGTGAAGSESVSFVVDSNNNTVLSATISGYTLPGSQAKTTFDELMALFGLEETYGGQVSVFTSSAYFHSTGTASMTYGTTTFPVTTYVANSLPESVSACGISSNITAFKLEVGIPPGTSLKFITYLQVATTSPTNEDITFQLVSMTVA